MSRTHFCFFYTAALSLFLLAGCQRDEAGELVDFIDQSDLRINGIAPSVSHTTLSIGEKIQLSVRTTSVSGETQELDGPALWASLDPSIATTISTGEVTAHNEGSTEIRASWNAYTTTIRVNVTAAQLQSINTTPIGVEINECQSTTLSATGTYTDGSTQSIPSTVSWTLTDPSLGRVSVSPDNSVTLTSVNAGSTTLSATSNQVTSSTPVVFLDTLASITIDQDLSRLLPGDSITLSATGMFSDDSVVNLGSIGQWTLSNAIPDDGSIVFNPEAPPGALLTAISLGTATLEFTCGGLTQTADIIVDVPPVLESIAINGGDDVDIIGDAPVQLELLAIYSDATTMPITELATWALIDGDIDSFALSTEVGTLGQITPLAGLLIEKTATVEATYMETSATTTVILNRGFEDTLQALAMSITDSLGNESALNPETTRNLALGDSHQLLLDATFLTSSIRVVATDVIWSNADPSNVTVNSSGVISALGVGSTSISAIYEGQIVTIPISVL